MEHIVVSAALRWCRFTTVAGIARLDNHVQPDRSREITVERPGVGQITLFKGRYFDETEWDGSDLFMPSDRTGLVFMLDHVRDAVQAARATGVLITLAAEHERVSR
jgi:hypothetical protein